MDSNTHAGASLREPAAPSGSLSAPVIVSDLGSPPGREKSRRHHSVQAIPGVDPTAPTPKAETPAGGSNASGRKRPNTFETDEASRLKLKRRQQREQYFDALAREADAMGNLSSSPRKICTEDDLEKLELKRCFELLHAMGRASDPNATIEATRASIGGFLQAIFQGWDTSVEIPRIPEITGVEVNAPAGRLCECSPEHASVEDCIRSNTCKTQIRVRVVYDHQSVTFTYYRVDLGDVKGKMPDHGNAPNTSKADALKEARYQRWLNGSAPALEGLPHNYEDDRTHESHPMANNLLNEVADPQYKPLGGDDVDYHDVHVPPDPEPRMPPKDDNLINPLTYPNLRIQNEWREVLKNRLHKALLKRMHEQNKYRALWIVRHMILGWEKGTGVKVEEDLVGDSWGFVRAESIQKMVLALV